MPVGLLVGVIDQHHASQADLIAIIDWLWLPGKDLLAVDKAAVDAVQIHQAELPGADDQLGVLSPYSGIMPTVRIEVDVWEDVTDRIFSPKGELGATVREGK